MSAEPGELQEPEVRGELLIRGAGKRHEDGEASPYAGILLAGVVLHVGDGRRNDQLVRAIAEETRGQRLDAVDEGHCASAGLRASASRSRR